MPTRRLTALLIVAFLVMQLLVPTVALFSHRPARFGWQMYANFPVLPTATLMYDDGSTEPVDVAAQFVVLRAEIDFASVLVNHLCAAGVSAVRVEWTDSEPETASCR